MTKQYDIVFCSLPPLSLERIYSAPPILKGVVQHKGYKSKTIDFSMTFFNHCGRDLDTYGRLQNWFIVKDINLSSNEENIVNFFIEYVVNTVKTLDTKYVGFSVLSVFTHKITVKLLQECKNQNLLDKVVLGGRGLSTPMYSSAVDLISLSDDERDLNFYEVCVKNHILKNYVLGDGEQAILDFLEKGTSTKQEYRTNIAEPKDYYPDYTDYDFSQYLWINQIPALEVTGSTGCVRHCDFCDVEKQFGKYKFKTGLQFAQELIFLQSKYKINKFLLTDSLSNGGLKPFNEFIETLAAYNETAEVKIQWAGTYICRDMRNYKNINTYYSNLKKSGAEGLTIGAESGSNHVLKSIGKNTTVEALFFELEKFREYNINCQLLTFIGHWSERHEDFLDHCLMLIKFVPYIRSGTIASIQLGTSFKILPGTPATLNLDIIRDKLGADFWLARSNRGNTYKVRAQRRLIVSYLAHILEFGVDVEETQLLQGQLEVIKNHKTDLDNFFIKHAKNNNDQFNAIANAQDFVNEILNYKSSLDIKIKVNVQNYNGDPLLLVILNKTKIFQKSLSVGEHVIEFSVDTHKLQTNNTIVFSMPNKKINDTLLDDNGNIISDKSIQFCNLYIDDCDVINDIDFFKKNFYNTKNGVKEPAYPGLWSSNPLQLDFDLPFVSWYSRCSTQNKSNHLSEMSKKQNAGVFSVEEFQAILENNIKLLEI
jgi:hypothetical protein